MNSSNTFTVLDGVEPIDETDQSPDFLRDFDE